MASIIHLPHTEFQNSSSTSLQDRLQALESLYSSIYPGHPYYSESFDQILSIITKARTTRPAVLLAKDAKKSSLDYKWFLSNELAAMSLYVDRFCGKLSELATRLNYLHDLGINYLHLMPLFQSPLNESDGGYAVSDFRKVDSRFGTLDDLKKVVAELQSRDMYLMLDIVLNHTSHHHEWVQKAKKGDTYYQEYFYMFDDETIPSEYEKSMPEIFPESSPGNFTYVSEINKWVMTVFHHYQWDLNFSNPRVLAEMLDHVLFYANLGVDVLRIDAPAFIWKQPGTSCQNLPQAHTILQILKLAVDIAAPGMALLGEAIVAPHEIMKYFGEGAFKAKECDLAYNATMMALQWEALATGKTKVLKSGHATLRNKPFGTTWITYTRCHDDIGLGFSDDDIRSGGFDPFHHRFFLQSYYSGSFENTKAMGALFSVNPKTNDARISGTLASLCGLEHAIKSTNEKEISQSIKKIILMQAHSFFIGGIPMLFYGDEAGYTNDYSYLQDDGKSYDNRWMHRPVIHWNKNKLVHQSGTVENRVFYNTKKLLHIRRSFKAFSDFNNFEWLPDENIHVSAFARKYQDETMICVFNFGEWPVYVSWYLFKSIVRQGQAIFDIWNDQTLIIGKDEEHLMIEGYGMIIAIVK